MLRYLNSADSLRENAAWYMYIDRIGDTSNNYAGANLVSFGYARNLHMFANIMHSDGYEGSLLMLDGNPLDDFANTARIRLRIKQGVVLQPTD